MEARRPRSNAKEPGPPPPREAPLKEHPETAKLQRFSHKLRHRKICLRALGFFGSARPTQEEVKDAYKFMAKRWHPDRNQGREAEATANFKVIRAAYDNLVKLF